MASDLRIVLDTNVFLVSILPHHKYWWVFESILLQRFTLLVSTDILTEYLEKIAEKYGLSMAEERLDFLLDLPNVERISPRFFWNLMQNDPDDNKMVDCALMGQADFIITHDRDFDHLKDVEFPIIQTLRLPEFRQVLEVKWGAF